MTNPSSLSCNDCFTIDAIQDPIAPALHFMKTRDLCAIEATCRTLRLAVGKEWARRDAWRRRHGTGIAPLGNETPRDREILFCQRAEFAQNMEWQDYRHDDEELEETGQERHHCRGTCSEYPYLFLSQNFDLEDLSYFVRLTKWEVSCNDETNSSEDGTLLWQGFVNNECQRDFSLNMTCCKTWSLSVPSATREELSQEHSVASESNGTPPFNPLFSFEYPDLVSDRWFENFQWHVTIVAVARNRNTFIPQRALVVSSCARDCHFGADVFVVQCSRRPFDPHHPAGVWGSATRDCGLHLRVHSNHERSKIGLERLSFWDDFHPDYFKDYFANDCDMAYDPTSRAELFYHGWDRQTKRQSRPRRNNWKTSNTIR